MAWHLKHFFRAPVTGTAALGIIGKAAGKAWSQRACGQVGQQNGLAVPTNGILLMDHKRNAPEPAAKRRGCLQAPRAPNTQTDWI